MISLKCPYCQVGLKVDETKLPEGINSFKCPKCKKSIPVSLLNTKGNGDNTSDTVLLTPLKTGLGSIVVSAGVGTVEQVFPLHEGLITIGRKSASSDVTCPVETNDKLMSRNHISIEIKKDPKGGYKHYLSDNNSKNRTLYNNKYLEAGEVVVLHDNDEIIIGRTSLRFKA
jgi:FHA domain.